MRAAASGPVDRRRVDHHEVARRPQRGQRRAHLLRAEQVDGLGRRRPRGQDAQAGQRRLLQERQRVALRAQGRRQAGAVGQPERSCAAWGGAGWRPPARRATRRALPPPPGSPPRSWRRRRAGHRRRGGSQRCRRASARRGRRAARGTGRPAPRPAPPAPPAPRCPAPRRLSRPAAGRAPPPRRPPSAGGRRSSRPGRRCPAG